MRAISDLFYGLLLPFNAFGKIIRRPKLILLSLFPLIVTVTISIYGLSALKSVLMGYGMNLLASWGWAAEGMTATVASFIFDLALIILGAMTFSVVAAIVAAPFNDFLAEATEPVAGLGEVPPQFTTWKFRAQAVWIDIIKTLAVGILQLGLLFAGIFAIWIPGLNLLFLTVAFALLAYQYLTYPQTRRGIGLIESIGFVRRNLLATLGFGASLGFLFAIPIVSALVLPLAVVGGTLLYGRAEGPAERAREALEDQR